MDVENQDNTINYFRSFVSENFSDDSVQKENESYKYSENNENEIPSKRSPKHLKKLSRFLNYESVPTDNDDQMANTNEITLNDSTNYKLSYDEKNNPIEITNDNMKLPLKENVENKIDKKNPAIIPTKYSKVNIRIIHSLMIKLINQNLEAILAKCLILSCLHVLYS